MSRPLMELGVFANPTIVMLEDKFLVYSSDFHEAVPDRIGGSDTMSLRSVAARKPS